MIAVTSGMNLSHLISSQGTVTFSPKQSLNFIQSEIHNVISSLRLAPNSRYATHDRFSRELPTQFQPPLLRALLSLQEFLHSTAASTFHFYTMINHDESTAEENNTEAEFDVRELDPLVFLQPFLDVVLSPNTSAGMTGRALSSINKFVLYGLVDTNAPNAKQAVNLLVCGLVQCQFEARSNSPSNFFDVTGGSESDGVALVQFQLLEVLLNVLRSEVGKKISDENVWKIVQIFYKIKSQNFSGVNPGSLPLATDNSSNVLLKSAAANALTHLVMTIFSRANDLINIKSLKAYFQEHAYSKEDNVYVEDQLPSSSEQIPIASHVRPYGLGIILKLLSFLSSLCDPGIVMSRSGSQTSLPTTSSRYQKNSINTRAFALQLVNIILETAASSLSKTYEDRSPIIDILQGNLCKYLLQNATTTNVHGLGASSNKNGNTTHEELIIVSLSLRVVFNLFNAMNMKGHLKVQLEVFLISIHMRLALANTLSNPSKENVGVSLNLKELALESLLDFCREPGMMLDLYVNYDCDVNCTNLFEKITVSLCKLSLPPPVANTTAQNAVENAQSYSTRAAPATLNSLNLLAVEGVLAIIDQLLSHLNANLIGNTEPTPESMDIVDQNHSKISIMEKKEMKRRLFLCAKEFNKKPHKPNWLLYAQDLNIIPVHVDTSADYVFDYGKGVIIQVDPNAVADFFLTTPGLDKTAVGDFLGDGPKSDPTKRLNDAVLKAFMTKIDIGNIRIDHAIRKVLEKFRLPGEAQKIDRIMDAFGQQLFSQQSNRDGRENHFENADGAFTLAFSIILLHTDLHNAAIKPEKKMTLEQFIRNNRGINDGKDFPPGFLADIYNGVKTEQMTMLYNPNDLDPSLSAHSNTTYSWEGVLQHSQRVAKHHNFHSRESKLHQNNMLPVLKDMASIVFEDIFKTLLVVLELTRDGKMIFKLCEGFFKLTKVCAILDEKQKVNQIIAAISNYFLRLSQHFKRLDIDRSALPNEVAAASWEEEMHGLQLMARTKYNLLTVVVPQGKLPRQNTALSDKGHTDEGTTPLVSVSRRRGKAEKLEVYSSMPLCKTLIVFNCSLILAKVFGSLADSSWTNLVRSIILVNNYDLLPRYFIEFEDIFDKNKVSKLQIRDPSSSNISPNTDVEKVSPKAQIENQPGQSFWGLLSSFLFTEESTSHHARNEEAVSLIRELISSWDINSLFSNCKALTHEARLNLLHALIDVIVNAKSEGLDREEANIILAIELVSEMIISLSHELVEVVDPTASNEMEESSKVAFDGYFKALRLCGISSPLITSTIVCAEPGPALVTTNLFAVIRSRIVERIVLNIMGISMRLLEKPASIQAVSLHALSWLIHLPPKACHDRSLSQKIGLGLSTVLMARNENLSLINLQKLFDICMFYSQFPYAVDAIYNSLAQIIIRQPQADFGRMRLLMDFVDRYIVLHEGKNYDPNSNNNQHNIQNVNEIILPARPLKKLQMNLFSELGFNYDFQDLFNSNTKAGSERNNLTPRHPGSRGEAPVSLMSFDSYSFGFEETQPTTEEAKSIDIMHRDDSSSSLEQERIFWSEVRAAKSFELILELLFTFSISSLVPDEEHLRALLMVLGLLKQYQRDHRRLVRLSVRKSFETILLRFTNDQDKLYKERTITLTRTKDNLSFEPLKSFLTRLSEETWVDIFAKSLVPLCYSSFDNVPTTLNTDDQNNVIPSPLSGALELEFEYSKLLINCFLQRISLLNHSDDFSLLWVKVIQVICKNIKVSTDLRSSTTPRGKELCDKLFVTSVEGLKNLLLVLRLELKKEEGESEGENNLVTLTLEMIQSVSHSVHKEVLEALDLEKSVNGLLPSVNEKILMESNEQTSQV